MQTRKCVVTLLLAFFLCFSLGGIAFAADEPATIDHGDNAWMLTSSALVLFMTAPGLALFYCGLVRKKNVLGVMMQCIFLMGLMTVVWALWGYSFAFGGDGAIDIWIGNTDHVIMNGVKMGDDVLGKDGEVVQAIAPGDAALYPGTNVPALTFMVFQGMFFIITPALICGAFAERMKFSTMVVFLVLWGTFVYCPLCHWVWDGGFLAYDSDVAIQGGALDFAGGTVVHISSGISALICALLIGKRLGFGTEDMRPHNMTYTAMGAAMLWVGWFGFNAGSAVAANVSATNAFVVTHFAAAAGVVSWAGIEWLTRGKPSILGAASGAVAGLVCITPASGFVQPMPAILMGFSAGAVCYFACSTIKSKFGYDDSLDAFGVHGVGGTLGAILTGVFASTEVDPSKVMGLYYNPETGVPLLIGQIVAVLITIVFAAVMTFVILKVLDVTMGLRVSQEEEVAGLDLSQHGEEGYIFS